MNKNPLITRSFKRVLDKLSEEQGLVKTHDAKLFGKCDCLGEKGMLEYSAVDVVIAKKKKAGYFYGELKKFGVLVERSGLEFFNSSPESDFFDDMATDAINSVYDLSLRSKKSSINPDESEFSIREKILVDVDTIKRAYTTLFIASFYENGTHHIPFKADDDLIRTEMEKVVDGIKYDGENTDTYAMGMRSIKLCLQRLMTFADVWEKTESPKKKKKLDH
jgi:hypothetical protein